LGIHEGPPNWNQGQPGDLGVLRGVARGVAEEARTRGFASPAFASFALFQMPDIGIGHRANAVKPSRRCTTVNRSDQYSPA